MTTKTDNFRDTLIESVLWEREGGTLEHGEAVALRIYESGRIADPETGELFTLTPAEDLMGWGAMDGPAVIISNGIWRAYVPKTCVDTPRIVASLTTAPSTTIDSQFWRIVEEAPCYALVSLDGTDLGGVVAIDREKNQVYNLPARSTFGSISSKGIGYVLLYRGVPIKRARREFLRLTMAD